ncbi:hypothetical protein N9903_00660 [bacterium]|nr:hypothetical protein [bacterium]
MVRQQIRRVTSGLFPALALVCLFPLAASANHSLGLPCYDCHNLSSAQIRPGTRALWDQPKIGELTYSRPVSCDFCHTGYRDTFDGGISGSIQVSGHPVKIIEGDNRYVFAGGSFQEESLYAGPKLSCAGTASVPQTVASCHRGNTVSGGPLSPLNPDLAPDNYDSPAGNTATDGYPDHDLTAFDGSLTPVGDFHLEFTYNKQASTDGATAATNYQLCFQCHEGGGVNTNSTVDVSTAYTVDGGHFSDQLVAMVACADCHDHHSSTSLKLYSRAGGIASDPNQRLLCLNCHDGASKNFYTTGGGVTPVTVPVPPTTGGTPGGTVEAHGASTEDCVQCHPAHAPSADRSDCFDCHGSGGSLVAAIGVSAIIVDDGSGDDFGYSGTNPSNHGITFENDNSGHCLDCHAIAKATHADGDTSNDLRDYAPADFDWPATTTDESAGGTFGALIEFCLSCHRSGSSLTWGTAPEMNDFIDFGIDKRSGGGDDHTNHYGYADIAYDIYVESSPNTVMYDTASGAGHDPPDPPLYNGVPLFAHYAKRTTNVSTPEWWQIGDNVTAPQAFPCLDCHFAHGGPSEVLYRDPEGDSSDLQSGTRGLCLDCHNGSAALEGVSAPDPTSGPLDDRYGNPVPAHDGASGLSCSSSQGVGQCHNPHSPSCEVCHGYPP